MCKHIKALIVLTRASQMVLEVKKKKKKPPANAENMRPVSIPGSGRSPGGGRGNPLQHSYLENLMDRGAWRAASP